MEFSPASLQHASFSARLLKKTSVALFNVHEIWRRTQRRMLMRLSINPIREYTLQSDMICKIFPCLGGCADAYRELVEKVALELIGVMLLWCFQTRRGCIEEETPKECTSHKQIINVF
jgi:hypothetical protein